MMGVGGWEGDKPPVVKPASPRNKQMQAMTRTGKCNLNLGHSELGRPKLSRTDWEYTLQNGRGRLVLVTSCHPDETPWPRQLEKSLFCLTVPEKVQKGRRVLAETTEQKAEKPHTEQHTESKEIELEMGRFQTVKARHQQHTFSSNAPPLKASIISPQRTKQGPSVQVCKTKGHISCLNHPGWSDSQEQGRMGEMMSAKTPGMKTVMALQTGTTRVSWWYVAHCPRQPELPACSCLLKARTPQWVIQLLPDLCVCANILQMRVSWHPAFHMQFWELWMEDNKNPRYKTARKRLWKWHDRSCHLTAPRTASGFPGHHCRLLCGREHSMVVFLQRGHEFYNLDFTCIFFSLHSWWFWSTSCVLFLGGRSLWSSLVNPPTCSPSPFFYCSVTFFLNGP